MGRTRAQRSRRRRGQRGQAMLEYSMLNWVLIVALALGLSARVIPSPSNDANGGQRLNVIEMFFRAARTYYDSFSFVLNLPFP